MTSANPIAAEKPDSLPTHMLIDGELVAGEGAPEKVVAPASGEDLISVPEATADQVTQAVAAARRALPGWQDTTPGERSALLLNIASALEAEAPTYGWLDSANCGKPRHLAVADDVPCAVDVWRFFAGAARCLPGLAAGEYQRNRTSFVRRDPIGVVAAIAPWNYPLMMAAWKIAPAIAAGNTVILKPSEHTPLSALKMAEVIRDLAPAGVINIVTGGGSVGAALASAPGVDMISLTGDVSTGSKVLEAAAKTMKRTHLELGGKAPVLVLADADVDAVAATVRRAGFYNSGQDCTAACRVYAHKDIYDRLVSRLAEEVSAIQVGDIDDPATDIGPLITERQRARVDSFVQRALDLGHIEAVVGGKPIDRPGAFFEPTVLAHAEQGDEIVRREVFGPVVSVTRFDDTEQAVAWANDSSYGLASSVWTQNISSAMQVSRRLNFGSVWINTHTALPTEMPHGGTRSSGYGKDLSSYALDDYTFVRHIMVDFS